MFESVISSFGFVCSSVMKNYQNAVVILFLAVVTGCESEDFSAPPAGLVDVRARAAKRSDAAKKDVTASVDDLALKGADENRKVSADQPKDATGELTKTAQSPSDTDVAVPSTDDVTANEAAAPDASAKKADEPELPSGSATSPDIATSSPTLADPEIKGKQAAAANSSATDDVKATSDSGKSDTRKSMSLLDKLKTSDTLTESSGRPARTAARQTASRVGRFAVAPETWWKLRNQLAKRFYVAATPDGSRLAVSSGEHSLEIVNSEITLAVEEVSGVSRPPRVDTAPRQTREPTTRSLPDLPGTITSIELIRDGDVVVIGTEDGRLMARHSADVRGRDVFSQDLLAYQDEHRASTKISESAIVVVRAMDSERLLTITADGECHVWNAADVIHEPSSPVDITEDQARTPKSLIMTSTPLYAVTLPTARVLDVSFSESGRLSAVITSDEQVTLFGTEDGSLTETISSGQLNDTQPVCVVIDEREHRVLIGLVDGRILSRSLNTTDAVAESGNRGVEAGYETVFEPAANDKYGAVTAVEFSPDGTLLYIGRLNGFVTQYDLQRKQLQTSSKLHTGPVTEIRSTPAGLFTIGDERVAKLSGVRTATAAAVTTVRLPRDQALRNKHLIEPDETMRIPAVRQVAVRANTDVTKTGDSLLEIRPTDPVLALYHHRLRTSADAASRSEIRRKIATIQPVAATVPETSRDPEEPYQIAEVETNFEFQSRPLRRAVMAVSDDGSTLAAAQYARPGAVRRGQVAVQDITVWDTQTGTRLRCWPQLNGVGDLNLDLDNGLLLPEPSSAHLELFNGDLVTSELPSISSQLSPQGRFLALGLVGQTGAATGVLELWGMNPRTRLSSFEAFEGIVPAIAWSADGKTVYASVRARGTARLLELEAQTLQVRTEIDSDSVDGAWNVERADLIRGAVGATQILLSGSGNLLVTYGRYQQTSAPYQLRIRRKSGDRWRREQMITVDSKVPILEQEMSPIPMTFVNQQETYVAVIGTKGVGVVNLRTGEIDQDLEIPDAGNRRPVSLFSSDGKWLLAGDNEGSVWVAALRSLQRKPRKFVAQAGPITGLAMSHNGQFLATAGEENRIRIWDVSGFLSGLSPSGK